MVSFLRLTREAIKPHKTAKIALQSNLLRAGLRIRRRVPGDGNCLFHALCDQLKYYQLARMRHLDLRNKVIDYMKEKPYIVSIIHFIIIVSIARHMYACICQFFNCRMMARQVVYT